MICFINENKVNTPPTSNDVQEWLKNRHPLLVNYKREDGSHTGVRYIEPYVYGATRANNPAIRAYQYWGDTKKGIPKWKLFRLDRFLSWEVQDDITFNTEPQARGWAAELFNNNGDGSMSMVYDIVNFDDAPEELTSYEEVKRKRKEAQLRQQYQKNTQNQVSPKIDGPITNDSEGEGEKNIETTVTSKPTQNTVVKNPVPLDDENFKAMLQRNLAITQKEKSKTKEKKKSAIQPIKTNGSTENNGNVEVQMDGPIEDATNPEKVDAETLMQNDEFQKMLQRNLQITQKEKDRRKI